MKRYDYERYVKSGKYTSEDRYAIIDRLQGVTGKLATAYDPADAERIVSALNALADTQAKPSNHNTPVLVEARAA